MEQQQQPGGFRGLLSNPDFLDRVVIGLGGLTMNPNQALMQMSADRIAGRAQSRQEGETKNRTVEGCAASLMGNALPSLLAQSEPWPH